MGFQSKLLFVECLFLRRLVDNLGCGNSGIAPLLETSAEKLLVRLFKHWWYAGAMAGRRKVVLDNDGDLPRSESSEDVKILMDAPLWTHWPLLPIWCDDRPRA